jgi:hypothetical protein
MTALPRFLIIGAMRAGTTSLYRDLEAHPGIFLPQQKEPNNLCDDAVLTPSGRARYARLFRPAGPGQICGEASTAYSKLPDFPGVPSRARQALGADLKLVYIVREPLARIRSQHHHETAIGKVRGPLAELARRDPRFAAYSSYARQLGAWLEAFPAEQVFVLRFEDYVAHRRDRIRELCAFLGADPDRLPDLADTAHNKAANRPTASPFWRRHVLERDWYAHHLKPRMPRRLRQMAARLLVPRAAPRADEFSPESLAHLVAELQEEMGRFERLFATVWPERYRGPAYDPRAQHPERAGSLAA